MPQIEKTIAEFIGDRELPSVAPGDTVAVAIALMKSRPIDSVVVVEDGKLVGVFTQRDFLNRVTAARRDVDTVRMREVMTPDPEKLAPTDCITYAINRMAVRGFRNIPIVDDDGTVLAVLSVRDVVRHLSMLFSELSSVDVEGWDEWNDIGGGA
jgi:CBS domain-containing protein